jgi:hypothetical protein
MENIVFARVLLGHLTPLKTDCGLVCGRACCAPDEDGQGGVQLFPGEMELYRHSPWARVHSGILYCDGTCPRDERPLGCRIFPLTPYRKESGAMGVRVDRRAFAMCPLARWGVRGLDPDFAAAALRALCEIDKTPDGRKFLNEWMESESIFGQATL